MAKILPFDPLWKQSINMVAALFKLYNTSLSKNIYHFFGVLPTVMILNEFFSSLMLILIKKFQDMSLKYHTDCK